MKPSSSKFNSDRSHFFQPLLPNFLTNFSIPKAFLMHYFQQAEGVSRGEPKNKCVVLKDKKTATTWSIQVDFPSFNFKGGWKNFCGDHNLQIGDFLVFRHQGNLVFEVSIFDPSGCERDFLAFVVGSSSKQNPNRLLPFNTLRNDQGVKIEDKDKEPQINVTFKPASHPYFCKVVTKSSLSCSTIYIPKEFALQVGLQKIKCEMSLVDEEGQLWAMGLRYNESAKNHYMYRWPSFFEVMGFQIGQRVIFEFISSNNGALLMKFYIVKLEKTNLINLV